jgi:hypothetical protein
MAADDWIVGGIKLRLKTARRLGSACAVVGGGLGAYVLLATAFNWLVAPSVAKSRAAIPPPETVVQRTEPAFSHLFHPGLPPRVVAKPPTAGRVAGSTSEPDKTGDAAPKKAARKSAPKTTRQAQPARDSWNPFSFAWGPSNGARQRF